MASPTTRVFTPSRIVALFAIALVSIGLIFLRFGSGDEVVSVPDAAEPGELILEPCTYPTEDGDYPADCGTLVVSENQAEPGSQLIALPVVRIRAQSAEPGEPIFYLTGGPGQSNMEVEIASRFVADRDLVLVGYRGIDGSVRLDCPEVTSVFDTSTEWLGEEHQRLYAAAFRACADRLGEDVDLARYGLAYQVEDLEAARRALGYDRINLLSESAGTRTALIYSWRYPESIHRSVMLGVNPPGAFLWDADTTDEQIGRYSTLCAEDASCSARTDDLAASMDQTATDIPDRWWFLPIKEDNVLVVSFFGLFESTSAGSPTPAPVTIDAWLSAAEGDSSGLWFTSVFGDLLMPNLFVWGQWASGGMLDAQAARDYFSTQEAGVNLGRAATTSGWGGGLLADAWPEAPDEDEFSRVRASEVETLLIGGALDVSTPPQVATRDLLPFLPNGREVLLPGFGHTGTLFGEQPEAGKRLINTFFASGEVDDSLYVTQDLDFTPSMTFGNLAKIALTAMVALGALALVSLVLMARRVHKRGRIGPRSSVLLRSVYVLLLGLGGWLLGSLVALTAMPAVRIDNELLVMVSVGIPVGLGIYWTWVDRDWSAETGGVGLAAAVSAALLGAWLGFNATAGLLAALTSIFGAVAGANLALIFLDITRDQANRSRSGAPTDPGSTQHQVREGSIA